MRKALRTIDVTNQYIGNILNYLNIAVVVIVCWEIVARYVFNAPTSWAADAPVMIIGYMVVLCGGYVQLFQRHVRIDSLYSHLGIRIQALFDIGTYCFFCLFMYAVIWHGWLFAWESIKLQETAGTPWNPIVYPLKTAIPVGAFLLWLQRTADIIRKVYHAFSGKEV